MTSITTPTTPPWESKRTPETRMVENVVRSLGSFAQVDSYRYNAASIRIRVVDPRFESLSRVERDNMVEKCLEQLPPVTQSDIVTMFTFAPSELHQTPTSFKEYIFNIEFDDPSPAML